MRSVLTIASTVPLLTLTDVSINTVHTHSLVQARYPLTIVYVLFTLLPAKPVRALTGELFSGLRDTLPAVLARVNRARIGRTLAHVRAESPAPPVHARAGDVITTGSARGMSAAGCT